MSLIDFLTIKKRENERVDILNTTVAFLNEDDHSFPVNKIIETNLHLLTIAAGEAKDIKIEDVIFSEDMQVYICYPMHRTIFFELKADNMQNFIYKISKIYADVFKSYRAEASVCCRGYEFLYITKIRIHENRILSIGVEYRGAL